MFVFDYLTFLDYYTNDKNLQTDAIGVGPLYYFVNKKDTPAKNVNMLNKYIIVNGVKIYVKTHYNKRHPERIPAVLFTIPTIINNELYDVHYHFGVNSESDKFILGKVTSEVIIQNKQSRKYTKRTKSKYKFSIKNANKLNILDDSSSISDIETIKPIEEIYFHKTIQVPSTNNMIGHIKHKSCKFNNNITIDNVYYIICNPEKELNTKTMESSFLLNELEQIREIISRPFKHHRGGKRRTLKKRKD